MSLFSIFNRRTVLAIILSLGAVGTTLPALHAEEQTTDDKKTIKVGVMDGEEGDVWKVAVDEAKKDGFNIELITFSDYIIPNEALNNGDLDANASQHKPYLDAQIEQRGYKLSIVGYTALFPVGVYSHKIKDISQLPDGATVGIPDDPSNEGRALRLLAQKGIITLKNPDDIMVTPIDIKDNPKNLVFRELNAGMVGRAIDDFDIAIVNTNWAKVAGLSAEKDAIAWEEAKDNPYNNIIVVRTEDKDKPWVKKLVASYQNEAVRAELKRLFGLGFATSW